MNARILTAGIVASLLLPCLDRGAAARTPRRDFCGASPSSRWSPGGASYVATTRFGKAEAHPLLSVNGIAMNARGELFVHDARAPHVYVLDEQLAVLRRFGREGGGPGELTASPIDATHYRANTVAASDTLVVVSDGSKLLVFTPDGRFVRDHRGAQLRRGTLFDVRGVAITPLGLVFGYWRREMATTGQTLLTLLASAETDATPTALHALTLVDRPSPGPGRIVSPPRQAEPLWGAFRGCVVVGDGESPWLLRLDLASGVQDTLPLPHHDVPPFGAHDQPDQALRDFMLHQGVLPETFSVVPTALWRYSRLLIDPDGHIWVEPWRRHDAPAPILLYRIDPSGDVHREALPAVPLAFGPPGVFYAGVKHADTDERLLVRYELRR